MKVYSQCLVKNDDLTHIAEQMVLNIKMGNIEKILNAMNELTSEQIKSVLSAVRSEREDAEIHLEMVASLETLLKYFPNKR